MFNIAAISGSLRKASINTKLLQAISDTASTNVSINICNFLGDLPLFNPDIEGPDLDKTTPEPVAKLRVLLAASDGVIIASPEYAHGITSVLKNALDWLVASGEFAAKPVAILNAAPRSSIANKALKEVLSTMDARLVPEASLDIPVLGNQSTTTNLLENPELSPLIRQICPAFMAALKTHEK